MIIRYTEQEFNQSKSYEQLTLECYFCQGLFQKKKSLIKSELKNPRNRNKYCDSTCSSKHYKQRTTVEIPCTTCAKVCTRKRNEVSESGNVYCNTACYNRRPTRPNARIESTLICPCGQIFEPNRLKTGNLSRSKYCNPCQEKMSVFDLTPLWSKTTSKAYISCRGQVGRHARKVLNASDRPKCCVVCGYDYYVEVCHIKAVKDFDEGATLDEINHLDNLIYLCPNHHKEFDTGKLRLVR